MTSLLIIQPYVPQYRVPFFDGLAVSLMERDIHLSVIAGSPHGAQQMRKDSARAPWLTTTKDWNLRLGGVTLTHVARKYDMAAFDAVIASAAGTSFDAYRALRGKGHRRRKVGLWGHIGSYVSPSNAVDMRLERWQMRNADHVFAYTPGGAQTAERAGVDSHKITTVMNSVSMTDLASGVVDGDFLSTYGLVGKKIFAFWGGIDESKRIAFLVDVLDHLWEADPAIHLVVGGRGEQENLFDRAVGRGQVTMFGFIDAAAKRSLAAVASGILMPGRIGLIAVESLALGLPIITTSWPYHAPEFEYLVEGDSVEITADDARSYAERVRHWQPRTAHNWTYPTLTQMVSNFSAGVATMLKRA